MNRRDCLALMGTASLDAGGVCQRPLPWALATWAWWLPVPRVRWPLSTPVRASCWGMVTGLGDLSHASVVFSRDARHAFVFGRDGGLTRWTC